MGRVRIRSSAISNPKPNPNPNLNPSLTHSEDIPPLGEVPMDREVPEEGSGPPAPEGNKLVANIFALSSSVFKKAQDTGAIQYLQVCQRLKCGGEK
jgi:hypothetical protein